MEERSRREAEARREAAAQAIREAEEVAAQARAEARTGTPEGRRRKIALLERLLRKIEERRQV